MDKQKIKSVPFIQKPEAGVALGYVKSNTQGMNPDRVWKAIRLENEVCLGTTSRAEAEAARVDKDLDKLERIVNDPNFLPAHFLTLGVSRSNAVCKIETFGTDLEGREGAWVGTGQLVSPNILLTNQHVLNSIEVCENATAIFHYEMGDNGKPRVTKQYKLNPSRLFLSSPYNGGLDFTFVWVDGEPGNDFGFIPLNRGQYSVSHKDVANVIQHPDGRLKEIVLQENKIHAIRDLVVHYVSDTEGGSSGSLVYNNSWLPYALHHKWDTISGKIVNEGVRLSAIAAAVETMVGDRSIRKMALEVTALFKGTDSSLGFFGALGRERNVPASAHGDVERTVTAIRGEENDIDVGFWNIEHFQTRWRDKLDLVARVIVDMNLDVWAFEESGREATEALVAHLKEHFGLEFDAAFSEPDAAAGKQTTTVIWNTKTVDGKKDKWPANIDKWFKINSKDFDEDEFEAVHGKIFDRYPGLYRFKAKNRPQNAGFDFYLVPVHLKAMSEGSMRRRMASMILNKAINEMMKDGKDADWVIGGDYNAELVSDDFRPLSDKGLVPLSARDEEEGGMTYLKSPKSLIDHIFLSPNLAEVVDPFEDYVIVAKEKTIPDYVKKISDHRPVMVRFQLAREHTEHGKVQLPNDLRAGLEALKTEAETMPEFKDVTCEEVEILRATIPGLPPERVPGIKLAFKLMANGDSPLQSVTVRAFHTEAGRHYNTFFSRTFPTQSTVRSFTLPATVFDTKKYRQAGMPQTGFVEVKIEAARRDGVRSMHVVGIELTIEKN